MECICVGLAVLCIAMCVVALRYRGKWDESLDRECDLFNENNELRDSRDWYKSECDRLGNSISALNIEVDATKEKLQKSEFQCDLLNKEIADKNARLLKLLDENNKLRSKLPKRDSKGRYCKK